jgi:hypothetical protein
MCGAAGGKRVGDKGFFIEPTVFADVKVRHHSSAACLPVGLWWTV